MQITTYREFKQRVDNLSAGMYRLGLRKADNILLQMPNCIEFMEVLFACLQIGIRPVLVLPTHRENEVRAFAKLLAPKAYISRLFWKCNARRSVVMLDELILTDIYI